MDYKELHAKAVRACEGAPVEVDGLCVYAVAIPDGFNPCNHCQMDCLCHGDLAELCSECDFYTGENHLLSFEPTIVS